MRSKRLAVVLAMVFILAACTGTPATSDSATTEPSESAAPPASAGASEAADEIGPAEQAELTIGFRFPNATFYLPQLVAIDQGYFEEEGLSIKEIVTAADLGAALSGNSIDIAMEWPEAPYQATAADLPMTIIGGYLCRTRAAFAVQPDVTSVEDLAGDPVTLAGVSGDLQATLRKNVLKNNGWDLDSVGVELVYPGPGSEKRRACGPSCRG